ncbi:MAG: Maf family protein [Thermoguttaceae bacterium]
MSSVFFRDRDRPTDHAAHGARWCPSRLYREKMKMQLPKLILASRSPRRQELLEEAGYRFEVCQPSEQAECGLCSGDTPAELVARLAYQKAADVARQVREGVILACDTVVECNGRILGKALDEHHARHILQTLSGQEHRVFSGLCLWKIPHGQPRIRVAITTLRMDRLSRAQLDEYLAGGQWEGKAGAFGYQDRLGWVHITEGSESNVVGLPLELLAEMLEKI